MHEFYQTMMGRKYYESDIPRQIKAMERLAKALEKQNELAEAAEQSSPGEDTPLPGEDYGWYVVQSTTIGDNALFYDNHGQVWDKFRSDSQVLTGAEVREQMEGEKDYRVILVGGSGSKPTFPYVQGFLESKVGGKSYA
jgi:hypothetical protein